MIFRWFGLFFFIIIFSNKSKDPLFYFSFFTNLSLCLTFNFNDDDDDDDDDDEENDIRELGFNLFDIHKNEENLEEKLKSLNLFFEINIKKMKRKTGKFIFIFRN
jgi:hypothetical protein